MFHVLMLPRIVCKLCHRQEIAPIVLASNDKLTEINLYPLVHLFGLSIGTRVESGTDVLLYACRFANCFSKVAGKLGIAIRDDALWDSKPREEMLEIELRYALTIYGLITGQEFSSFRASLIYNG